MRKEELKDYITVEKKKNIGDIRWTHVLKLWATNDPAYLRYRYIKYLRLSQFCKFGVMKIWYERKKNTLGIKLGYEIGRAKIGKGFTIFHNGPVVINGNAVLGSNVSLHGDNCIGNNGFDNKAPTIGDNVNIGVGAKIIGGITIANGVNIGAGAVVIKSIEQEGCTVVGVPAKIIS